MPNGAEQNGSDDSSTTAPPVAATPGSLTTISTGVNEKRQAMLDLIAKWMPTSLNNPMVPTGETQDLLAMSGWTKKKGQESKQVSDDNRKNGTRTPVATSCGDVLATMLRLWKSEFIGAFMIRDVDSRNRKPGARERGYYVDVEEMMKAKAIKSPKRGDIIVLRNGVGKGSAGSVGLVGILIEGSASVWRTADGGGGQLPDQTASVTDRKVKLSPEGIPILISPTDGREKQLDGWVDLDQLPRQG